MADNLSIVPIPQNTWVDLYAGSGIAVGSVLQIENSGADDVYLAVQEIEPTKPHKAYNVIKRPPSVNMQNSDGDLGAWAYCSNTDGQLSISSPAKEGFLPTISSNSHDGYGNPIGSLKGAIDVHIADVHNIPVNDFFHRHTATQTTLTAATVSGDTQLEVADSTGFVVGDLVHLGATNEYLEPRHPIITDVPDINTIVLDGPIHNIFAIGTPVIKAVANLASLNGTLAAPISYKYFTGISRVEHITRILISMTHDSLGADDLFGGITALLNGIHFRSSISGQFGVFTNWKSNGDIKLDMFDVEYSVKSGPGDFGTNGRGSFSRIGVVVRLDSAQSDFIELLVQDVMVGTGLSDLRIKAQGHVEGE